MKISIVLIAAVMFVASCERERPIHLPPGFDMSYNDLPGKEIPYSHSVTVDLNSKCLAG